MDVEGSGGEAGRGRLRAASRRPSGNRERPFRSGTRTAVPFGARTSDARGVPSGDSVGGGRRPGPLINP